MLSIRQLFTNLYLNILKYNKAQKKASEKYKHCFRGGGQRGEKEERDQGVLDTPSYNSTVFNSCIKLSMQGHRRRIGRELEKGVARPQKKQKALRATLNNECVWYLTLTHFHYTVYKNSLNTHQHFKKYENYRGIPRTHHVPTPPQLGLLPPPFNTITQRTPPPLAQPTFVVKRVTQHLKK